MHQQSKYMRGFLNKIFKKEIKKEETISLPTVLSNLIKLEAVSSFGKVRLT